MMDEKKKNELVKKIVEASYPDFYKIENDEEMTYSDLEDYQKFCNHSLLKDKASWKHYMEIKYKVRTKGVGSILFSKEVKEVWKSTVTLYEREAPVDVIYVSLDKMPTFAVTKDGTILDYQ